MWSDNLSEVSANATATPKAWQQDEDSTYSRESPFKRMENRITIDPGTCNGRPIVRGTRITVQTVLEFLAAGDSVDDVLEEYPSLTREDVQACLLWASRLMGNHFEVARVP